MKLLIFLVLGAVFSGILNFAFASLAGILGAIAVKAGLNWPPENPHARRDSGCVVLLAAVAVGFWASWLIVM